MLDYYPFIIITFFIHLFFHKDNATWPFAAFYHTSEEGCSTPYCKAPAKRSAIEEA